MEKRVYINRISKVKERLRENSCDAFITFNHENIRYLCGFTGSSGALIISLEESVFLTDFRYKEQSAKEVSSVEIIIYEKMMDKVNDVIGAMSVKALAFEEEHISFKLYKNLKNANPYIEMIGYSKLLEDIRAVKDDYEILRIRESIDILKMGFEAVIKLIVPGTKEVDLAAELEYRLKLMGAERTAFDLIVASGANSAMPHASPTSKEIEEGDLVVIDFGVQLCGYNSDVTRTVVAGDASERQIEIYGITLGANEKAIKCVAHGVSSHDIDSAARDFITASGYGEFFGHSTGHGVGLNVHEEPVIKNNNSSVIEEGMVFTIEPGIYIPSFGGVRIEDMVLVTKEGCEVLTSSICKKISIV